MDKRKLETLAYLDALADLFGADQLPATELAARLFADRMARPADLFADGRFRGRMYIVRDPVTGKPWFGNESLYHAINNSLRQALLRAARLDRRRLTDWADQLAGMIGRDDPALRKVILEKVLKQSPQEQEEPPKRRRRKAAEVVLRPREGVPTFRGDRGYHLGDATLRELGKVERIIAPSEVATPADLLRRAVPEWRKGKRRSRIAKLLAQAAITVPATAATAATVGPIALALAPLFYWKVRSRVYPTIDYLFQSKLRRLATEASHRFDTLSDAINGLYDGPSGAESAVAATAVRQIQEEAARKFRQEYQKRRQQFARMSPEQLREYIRQRAPAWVVALQEVDRFELPELAKRAAVREDQEDLDRLLERVKQLYPELKDVHVYHGKATRFRDLVLAPGPGPWYRRLGGRVRLNRLLPPGRRLGSWFGRWLRRNPRESSYVLNTDAIVIEPQHPWPTLLHELGHALDFRRRLQQAGLEGLEEAVARGGPYPLEDDANRLGEEMVYRLFAQDPQLRRRLAEYWADIAESVQSYYEDQAATLRKMEQLARDPEVAREGYRLWLRRIAGAEPDHDAQESPEGAGKGKRKKKRDKQASSDREDRIQRLKEVIRQLAAKWGLLAPAVPPRRFHEPTPLDLRPFRMDLPRQSLPLPLPAIQAELIPEK